jgi:hypothetical protein
MQTMPSDDEPVTLYFLFHFPHWFIITWHDFYCFTSLIGSSLLGMVCFLSFMLHWFIITGHGLYGLTTSFTGSSLLGMVCIFSLHAELILHY